MSCCSGSDWNVFPKVNLWRPAGHVMLFSLWLKSFFKSQTLKSFCPCHVVQFRIEPWSSWVPLPNLSLDESWRSGLLWEKTNENECKHKNKTRHPIFPHHIAEQSAKQVLSNTTDEGQTLQIKNISKWKYQYMFFTNSCFDPSMLWPSLQSILCVEDVFQMDLLFHSSAFWLGNLEQCMEINDWIF